MSWVYASEQGGPGWYRGVGTAGARYNAWMAASNASILQGQVHFNFRYPNTRARYSNHTNWATKTITINFSNSFSSEFGEYSFNNPNNASVNTSVLNGLVMNSWDDAYKEITSDLIRQFSNEIGPKPSGQGIINAILRITTFFPNSFVTGYTLASNVTNITEDAKKSLGNINSAILSNGKNITISGATKITIISGLLSLNISNGASFNLTKIDYNGVEINVTGIKVGPLNLKNIKITSNSVIINIGGVNRKFDVK